MFALGAEAGPKPTPRLLPRGRLPDGWSAIGGGAASLAAAVPLDAFPAEPGAMAEALAGWALARLKELRSILPDLAAAA